MANKYRVPWTALFAVGFVVLGSFPLFPAQIPGIALDEPLGKVVYIGFLVLLGVGFILTEVLLDAARQQGEDKRESLAEQRHEQQRIDHQASTAEIKADFAHQFSTLRAALEVRAELRAQGVSATDPKMQRVEETVRVSTATIGGLVSMGDIFSFYPQGNPTETKAPVTMPSVKSTGAQQP